jgi:nucleoside phosphorylase
MPVQIIERFLGSDPIAGDQALQELLSLGDKGEERLFSRHIEHPPTVQVRRRWLRYVASRNRSIAGRLIDRMKNQDRFSDGYAVAYLYAGLERDPSIVDDLYAQLPASGLFKDYSIPLNYIRAWGYAGGDSSILWHRVKEGGSAWEKLSTFAFRASCAAFARINARDSWAIEQLITHESRDYDLVELSSGPEDLVSNRAISGQELSLQANDTFLTWRRGEVADEVLQSWAEHAHWRVRGFGAQVLASLGYQRTVSPVIAWLSREPIETVRRSLLHALARSDTTAGADALVDHFLSSREGANYVAKAAWRATDKPRAVAALNAISNDEPASSEAVVSLAKLRYRPADLNERLDSPNSYRRLNAALGLAYLGDHGAIDRLMAMRREAADPFERVILSAALALLEGPNAAAELHQELIASAALPNYSERIDIFFLHRYFQRAILDGLATGTASKSDVCDAWGAEIEPFEPIAKPVPVFPIVETASRELTPEVTTGKKEATQSHVTDFSEPKSTAVILTALEVETRAILRHLGECNDEVVGGTIFALGYFGDWKIAVAEVGAGNSGAAAIAERAVQKFRPSVALFVGVAGGIKDVSIGDVVIATKVYGYESGKETDGGLKARPDVQISSHALEQRGRAIRLKDEWKKRLNPTLSHTNPRIFVGPIAAGEKVVASTSSATAEMLRQNYGDALAVEMEGRGFLGGVHLNPDVQACVIRGISDVLDKKADADASGSQYLAADAASAVAMELLFALGSSAKPKEQSAIESASVNAPPAQMLKKLVSSTARGEKSSSAQARTHVVILVHGIRDFALWQTNVRDSLEKEGFKSESTNYGRFNLIEFLLPFSYFRRKAIDIVWRQIRIVKQNNEGALLSVIAHSFGTYVIARLMQDNFDIKFHRVIFCGSVVRYSFPFEQIQNRFQEPIINDVGTSDIWPGMAESLTTGYGSAGSYGFRRPLVRDRWHNGARHGYFLSAEFCKKYWVPLLRNDTFVSGADAPESPPLWLRVLSVVKIKYVLSVILLVLLVSFARHTNVVEYLHTSSTSPAAQSSAAQQSVINGNNNAVKQSIGK